MLRSYRSNLTSYISSLGQLITFLLTPFSTRHISHFPALFFSLNSMHCFQTRFGKDERIQNQTVMLSFSFKTVPPLIA